MKKIMIALMLLSTIGISAKTIATVNGYAIDEKEANAFLKVATKGKVTYKRLKRKDKKSLVERLAVDKLVLKTAMKEISKKEQENIIAGYWLRQKASKYKVSNKEVKKAYKKNKRYFKDKKGKIIPYSKVKAMIKNSIAQKKAVAKMLDKATIIMDGKVISSPKKKSKKSATKSKKKDTAKKTRKSSAVSGRYSNYVVKSGNTLSGIATKYGITTKALLKMNGMTKSVLKVGQKLKVPAK